MSILKKFAVALFVECMCVVSFLFASEKNNPALDMFRVCSFNLNGSSPKDKGIFNWNTRQNIVADFFEFSSVDICGTQESTDDHIASFSRLLKGYGFFGLSSLGERNGEMRNLVLYKKSRFKLIKSDTFWLSIHPNDPVSKDWGAREPRAVSYGLFIDKRNNKEFYFFSVYIDETDSKARSGQMNALFAEVKKISGDTPFIIVGDFNALPNSSPMKYAVSLSFIKDAYNMSITTPKGANFTFHDASGKCVESSRKLNSKKSKLGGTEIENCRTDYIFISEKIGCKSYEISTYLENGVYPSDHFPTLCDIDIN